MKALVLTLVACSLALPSIAQEAQETARGELRELTYAEESDRVLAHLVSLLPQARGAAQFEAAVDHWVADLSPADTVNVRHRIDELLRDVPDGDLYGLLLAMVRHRAQETSNETEIMGASSASSQCRPGYFPIGGRCCLGGGHQSCYNPNPIGPPSTPTPNPGAPPPYPQATIQALSAAASQLGSARGNCSELRRVLGEINAVRHQTGCQLHNPDPCATLQARLAAAARGLMREAGC